MTSQIARAATSSNANACQPRQTELAPARARRARLAPARFRRHHTTTAVDGDDGGDHGDDDETDHHRVVRAQLRRNLEDIRATAERFRCPLLAKSPRRVRVTPDGKRRHRETRVPCRWLGAQPKKLAVADDGHYYDFATLTRFLTASQHRQIRSPVTGAPMGSQVYHLGVCKSTGKPRVVTWRPPAPARHHVQEVEDAEWW